MTIAVIGAGAIGNLVAGYLKLKGTDVSLVGNIASVNAIKKNGLEISGVRGDFNIPVDIEAELKYRPALAVLATKTQDLEEALKKNLNFLKDTTILTIQNGIRADEITARLIPKENIISSIVMFGATCLEPGKVVHNFEGDWVIGEAFSSDNAKAIEVRKMLNRAFSVIVDQNISGMKCLKIFVNANNCIPAILGMSIQEAFSDFATSRISIGIWKEGLEIVSKSGIDLVSLPDFPLERLTKLTALPTDEAAKIISGIMTNLSKVPLFGSILQSIKRGKPSEIDYINGEFVVLAEKNNLKAPLNKKLTEMVHTVEATGKFFSREDLLNFTQELLS